MKSPLNHFYRLLPLTIFNKYFSFQQSSPTTPHNLQINENQNDNKNLNDDGLCLVIDETCDGSPSNARYFILWNPTLTNTQQQQPLEIFNKEFIVSEIDSHRKDKCSLCQDPHFTDLIHSQQSSAVPIIDKNQTHHSNTNKNQTTITPVDPIEIFLDLVERNNEPFNKLSRKRRTQSNQSIQSTNHGDNDGGDEEEAFSNISKQKKGKRIKTSSHNSFQSAETQVQRAARGTETATEASHSIQASFNRRQSSLNDICSIFYLFLQKRRKTLLFCKTRKLLEIILQQMYDKIEETSQSSDDYHLQGRVVGYRGGYTKEDRRKIEQSIFSGNMLGIVSTCALELGINIGTLDSTLHLGIPDTYSSLLQQVGRCGRQKLPSSSTSSTSSSTSDCPSATESIIVCNDNPIDQYYARHPNDLFQYKKIDDCLLQYDNFYIFHLHILCGIKEFPFHSQFIHSLNSTLNSNTSTTPTTTNLSIEEQFEIDLWGQNELNESFQYLLHERMIYTVNERIKCHPSITNPFKLINLRLIETTTFQLISRPFLHSNQFEVLEVIEYSRLLFELYEGAIYLHQGKQYLITEVNLEKKLITCSLVRVNYYTTSHLFTSLTLTRCIHGNNLIVFGLVSVHQQIQSFSKVFPKNSQVEFGGNCSLPPLEYVTCGLSLNIPSSLQNYISVTRNRSLGGSLHIINHAIQIAINLLMDENISHQIETEHWHETNQIQSYRIFFYDKKPGGIGACEAVYHNLLKDREKLFNTAKNILLDCNCLNGCPSCVFNHKCSSLNANFDKIGGIYLLEELICCLKCSCQEDNPADEEEKEEKESIEEKIRRLKYRTIVASKSGRERFTETKEEEV